MALYQKARPITFAQVIGQDHVTDVLVAAIAKNRVGHAYLFSGPRGVGKTTSARLLAMAVNCERKNEIDAPPCGTCESCRLVQAGNHPDVIELDAASNNSVEDVRDLREKVRLASIRGGMRVWILDEAHMLSKAAANALLKTLEEPPANLIFILATTEPERLPPTILSRCQHYRFRRLSEEEIASKLEQLAQNAQVEVQPEAMKLIARAADGAMRDGESLLERLLSTGNAITVEVAEDALGLPPQGRMEELATALAKDDVGQMLQLAGNLYQAGFAPRSLAERLQITLRDALYAAVGVAGYSFAVALEQAELLRAIHALDDGMEAFVRHDDLLSLESILIKTRNTICKNVPSDAAFQAAPVQVKPPQEAQQAAPTLPDFNPTGARTASSVPKRRDARASRPSQPTAAPRPSAPIKAINWHDVQRKANGKLKAFMRPAQAEVEGNHLTLTFAKKSNFHYERLLENRHELEALLQQHYGEQALLTIVSPEGKRTHSQRPNSSPVSSSPVHHQAAAPSVQQLSTPVTTSSEVKTIATEHKPIPQPTTVKPAAEATASQPRANNKPPELQQVERQEKKQASAVKAPPTSNKTKATSANEMGYSSVQYSGEEELPPDFWDSPPVARNPVAQGQAEAQQPKKTSVDTAQTGSVEESLPPDFWDSPAVDKQESPSTQAKPAARKILSAAASNTKGIALTDVLRHFPGRVIEEIIEEVEEEVEEAQEASVVEEDDTVGSLEKTSALATEVDVETEEKNMPVKDEKGLLEPIASSDAITDIEALSPLADRVTAGEGLLELNSATATNTTETATETATKEQSQEPSEPSKTEPAKKDAPKEKKSNYAQSLF